VSHVTQYGKSTCLERPSSQLEDQPRHAADCGRKNPRQANRERGFADTGTGLAPEESGAKRFPSDG
jgi:hypothetical protein